MTTRLAEIEAIAAIEDPIVPPPPNDLLAFLTWDQEKVGLIEGTQNHPLILVLSRPLPLDILIHVVYSGTATRELDYDVSGVLNLVPGFPEFDVLVPAGHTSAFFNISTIGDVDVEPGEFVDFQAQPFVGTHGGAEVRVIPVLDREEVRVGIFDAPAAPPGSVFWQFESATYSWNEDQNQLSTRVRVLFSEPLPEDTAMRFWTVDGTAVGGVTAFTPGADYVIVNAQGTLFATTLQFSIPIRLIDDSDLEGAEDFELHGEVLTPGSRVVDGVNTVATITINPSDVPATTVIAGWGTVDPQITIVELAPAIRLRVVLSAPAQQNLFIPVSVVATSGDLQRITLGFPGGSFGTVVIQAGQSQADILLSVPNRAGVQPTMTYELTIGDAPGVEAAPTDTIEIIVLDAGVILPVVSFRELVQATTTESTPPSDVLVRVDVTNPLVADLSTPFSVDVEYDSSGGAVYAQDFRVYQVIGGVEVEAPSVVNFGIGETSKLLRLRPINDAQHEPSEDYRLTLVDPVGCTLGAIPSTTGTILDNDVAGNGAALRPQFYFASEVFGRGPNADAGNRCNIIADLGPGVTFSQDVYITLGTYGASYSGAAPVESTDGGLTGDYWFPGVQGNLLRIPAGSRYGTCEFQALPDGVSGTLKWVVVTMDSTTHGVIDEYWQQNKWVAVLCGAADNEGLVPIPDVPSDALDDFEVYADRIEDLTTRNGIGPLTIPLPFRSAGTPSGLSHHPDFITKYGNPNDPTSILYRFCHFVDQHYYWNGPAIAAHLAQATWLDRNGGSFGTRRVYDDPNSNGEVHWIEPAVRWLEKGVPVYISVYEQAINGPGGGPHSINFASDNTSYDQRGTAINWGRGIPTGTANQWHPSCTRDLYITARAHQHIVKLIEFGAVQKDTAPSNILIQSFVDNIHLIGFRFATDPTITSGPLADASNSVLGRIPPTWLTTQKLWYGFNHLHLCDWTTTTLAQPSNVNKQIRVSNPGSWMLTNCTATRAQTQWAYFDSTGPIFIMAYNEAPVGTGYSLLQLVSRNQWRTMNPQTPLGGHSSGPSHGLVACVENEMVGRIEWGQASDFEIYGHLGYAFFVGNRHRGNLGYNRRLITLLSSGNEEGQFVADAILCDLAQPFGAGTPTLSPQAYFTTRYVEIDKMDVDLSGAGGWVNCAIDLTGCYKFVFKPMVNASSVAPMNTNPASVHSGRSFFHFNAPGSMRPNYEFGAIMADALNRPIYGQGYTLPSPMPPGFPIPVSHFFPNRGGINTAPPGGISFPSGFDAAGVAGGGDYCGSTRKADHWLHGNSFFSSLQFSSLTGAVRDAYDGTDPF